MEAIFGDDATANAVYRKLKAAGISTWVLLSRNGKSVMHTRDDLFHPDDPGKFVHAWDWDEFIDTMIHPDDRGAVRASMAEAMASPDNFYRVEYRIYDAKSDTWNWLFAFGSRDPAQEEEGVIRVTGGVQDIRERFEIKKRQEKERVFNATLIESLPGWFLVITPEGRIIHKSHKFIEGLSSSVMTLANEDWTSPLPEEYRHIARKTVAAARDGKTHGFRCPVEHAGGGRKTYWFQCRRFTEDDEVRVLVLIFDVTAETQAESEVQRQRSQLDTVISAANLGTWDWNLVTGEVTYNSTWAEIVGYDLNEIQGSVAAWENAVLPEDLPKAMDAVDAHVAGETPMYEAEFRMIRGDGTIIWGLDRGRVVEHDEQGTVIRLLGVLQDITKEKEAERELANSKNQMEMIMREVRFGTWDWNLVTEEIHFNETFFTMLGYEPGELGSNFTVWEKLIHPDDIERVEAHLLPLQVGKADSYECEMRMLHKDGHYVWTYDMGRAVAWDAHGHVLRAVGGHVDIDSRIRQEQEQREALKTIARQKKTLEETVQERTLLLRSIKERVSAIAADTGQLQENGDDASAPFEAVATKIASGEALPEASSGIATGLEDEANFADSLGRAFDVITEKMWWYKGVIDSIPFPIYVTDMKERWTYLNAPALENLGLKSLKDVVGRPSERWGVEQPDAEADAREDGGESRRISRYHPGRKRFFQGQASFLRDQSGRRIGHIEAVQDVTKMHEADQRTRIMLDATPLACTFWNSDFQCVDCNLAAAGLFHVPDKQAYLDNFWSFQPDKQPDGTDSREEATSRIKEAFNNGYTRFEWLFRRMDGSLMPAEITLVRVEHGGGHIVLGYTRDLTELKQKEAEVDKERRLLTKIMDSSPVCFVILVKGRVRFATPFALQFFGIEVGTDISSFYTDTEARAAFFREVQQSGTLNWRVVSMRAASGEPREMLANAFLAEYFGEPCVMSWFLDVTEMRETERQLRLARDAAEESTRAKGEFLANMSHEIRTPMNAILGMTRLVLDTQLTQRQRGYLQKAEQSARALLRILNDILDFSKIEAGKLEMEMADFSLDDIMQAVTDMFRSTAESKGLDLELCMQPEGPLFLRGDPLRLHQVLLNLVGNALKFTSRGGVTISVEELERAPRNVRLCFSVRDTGIGLSPEQASRLFSAFSQADTSTTRRYGGTGLGLAISKRLVEMMHGEISCESKKGEGTVFRFTALFPFAESGAEGIYSPGTRALSDEPGAPARPEDAVEHLKGKRILVAEDNEINQIVVREMLEKAGFIVDIAADGQQALEKALANQYDLIFMDIQMPVLDGLTAAAKLREHGHLRTLPIIAMTAHAMVGDREKSLAVGMNAHVTKPIDPDEVFAVIGRWLGE